MSHRLFLTTAARSDLAEISRHLRIEDPELAARFKAAFQATATRVVKRPVAPAVYNHPAAAALGLRKVRVERFPNHLIFYVVQDGRMIITRILHAARDLPRALGL